MGVAIPERWDEERGEVCRPIVRGGKVSEKSEGSDLVSALLVGALLCPLVVLLNFACSSRISSASAPITSASAAASRNIGSKCPGSVGAGGLLKTREDGGGSKGVGVNETVVGGVCGGGYSIDG